MEERISSQDQTHGDSMIRKVKATNVSRNQLLLNGKEFLTTLMKHFFGVEIGSRIFLR